MRFKNLYLKRNWEGSWKEAERNLRKHIVPALQAQPITQVNRQQITALLDSLHETPALAKSVFTLLRKLFRWAVARGDLPSSPMSEMESPSDVPSRDRVLTDSELALVWSGTGVLGYPFGPMVRLLIATGQRRSEVAALEWSELDLERGIWTLPAAKAKNNCTHLVPLNHLAVAELSALERRCDLVFTTNKRSSVSGFSKAKSRLDRIVEETGSDVAPWRLHDLRRTVATGLQRVGVRLEVTEAILNHVSGSRAGVVGIYQRHNWAAEKKQALDAWAEHLKMITAAAPEQE